METSLKIGLLFLALPLRRETLSLIIPFGLSVSQGKGEEKRKEERRRREDEEEEKEEEDKEEERERESETVSRWQYLKIDNNIKLKS
jgi:hypothetical protein